MAKRTSEWYEHMWAYNVCTKQLSSRNSEPTLSGTASMLTGLLPRHVARFEQMHMFGGRLKIYVLADLRDLAESGRGKEKSIAWHRTAFKKTMWRVTCWTCGTGGHRKSEEKWQVGGGKMERMCYMVEGAVATW